MNLVNRCETLRDHFETMFEKFLTPSQAWPEELWDAIRYSCLMGGKRLRPLLVYLTGESLGIARHSLDAAAIAVELIHCYSLVHDDLPAMDDDELRRGRPSCHIAFGEAAAILAGDAMQSLAFEKLSESPSPLNAQQQISCVRILSEACGPFGMIGGQAKDLASEGQSLRVQELVELHRLKTGALIRASVHMAAVIAECPAAECENLLKFADELGLAFQIRDDILDETATTAELGKPQGSDRDAEKATFVSQLGLEKSEQYLQTCHQTCLENLIPMQEKAYILREFSEMLLTRKF